MIAVPCVSMIAMAIRASIENSAGPGDKPRHTPLIVLFTDIVRVIAGALVGLAAILLPAVAWQNIEALYTQFGAPALLVMIAPIAILVRTYGGSDDAD